MVRRHRSARVPTKAGLLRNLLSKASAEEIADFFDDRLGGRREAILSVLRSVAAGRGLTPAARLARAPGNFVDAMAATILTEFGGIDPTQWRRSNRLRGQWAADIPRPTEKSKKDLPSDDAVTLLVLRLAEGGVSLATIAAVASLGTSAVREILSKFPPVRRRRYLSLFEENACNPE